MYSDLATFSLLFGGTYSPTDWLRVNAMLDGHSWVRQEIRFTSVTTPLAGGLSFGAEAGTQIFGALTVRGSYENSAGVSAQVNDGTETADLGISGQLAIGIRER